MTYVEYFSTLTREIKMNIDEELLIKFLSFIDISIDSLQEQEGEAYDN
jgi:hypothetical protein